MKRNLYWFIKVGVVKTILCSLWFWLSHTLLICCRREVDRWIRCEFHQWLIHFNSHQSVIYWPNSLWLIPRSGASINDINRVSSLIILGYRTPPVEFFFYFYWKSAIFGCKKREYSLTWWPEFSVTIHWQNKPCRSHTLKTSQSRSSFSEVTTCICLKCWRKQFLSLKSETLNWLELMIIVTGDRDVSTSGVHSWNVCPDTSSSTLLSHRLITRLWARSCL